MSDMQKEGDSILHQDAVEAVADARIADQTDDAIAALSTHAAIADLVAASGSYVQAEATATRTTLNAVLAVLRDIKAIPTS